MTTLIDTASIPVTIDGFAFNTDDGDGLIVVCTGLTGWYDGPGSRASFTDRPNDHGSFDAQVYRSSRVVTASGWAFAPSRGALMAKLRSITGVLGAGQAGVVTVADPDYGTMSITARLTDGPQLAWSTWESCWSWQLQVTAPDPLKYGPSMTTSSGLPYPGSSGLTFPLFDAVGDGLGPDAGLYPGPTIYPSSDSGGVMDFGMPGNSGRIVLDNPGTADTWATFQVSGPVLGGVVISDVDSGRQIVWANDVPAGANLLIIDSSSGHSYLNGALRDSELTVKQWWPIPAGGSSTVQFSTLGATGQTGTLTALWSPAYW